MDKWIATFVSTHGLEFTVTTTELAEMHEPMSMLQYIAYVTDAKSTLISLKKVED